MDNYQATHYLPKFQISSRRLYWPWPNLVLQISSSKELIFFEFSYLHTETEKEKLSLVK